jgi:6-phosphogluconolactonase
MTSLQIFDTTNALTHSAAAHIITLAQKAMDARGRFSIALSGGSTPKPVYEQLAAQKARLDWSKVHLFWGDERCVPPNHPNSNYHMAHQALLRYIDHECGNIHRMRGEIDPHAAAQQYETPLRTLVEANGLPRFDLILLGMGDDGHTASLFPHTTALNQTERWCVANEVAQLQTWRLTLTAPVINQARQITFLISGEKKAAPLYEVLHGEHNPQEYPSQLIKPTDGQLTFLVDRAAAAKLP